MNPFKSIAAMLQEPPPAMVFEVSEQGLAVARMGEKTRLTFQRVRPGTISVSPLRDNILLPDELALAVRSAAPPNGTRRRRDVAVILPDYCTRLAVLDFDNFPSDPKERSSLIRFRMKKSVPFDIDEAAVTYWPQPGEGKKYDVVVVVTPLEIVARYEAPFRAAGLNPGLVTTSSVAALNLVEDGGTTVVAKLSGRVLSVMVLQKGRLRLARCLELASATVAEIAADLYPTFVYIEDNLGTRAERLLLCGFGEHLAEARPQFQRELQTAVDPLGSAFGTPGEHNAGLLGYLQSVGAAKGVVEVP